MQAVSVRSITIMRCPKALRSVRQQREMQRLFLLAASADSSESSIDEQAKMISRCGFATESGAELPSSFSGIDLTLLDVDGDLMRGIDYVRAIRDRSSVPLLVLSSSQEVTECVMILDLGADAYVRKPIASLELAAQVKALLRRTDGAAKLSNENVVEVDDISLNTKSRMAKQNGAHLKLTSVEFDLLRLLLESTGKVLTREVISQEVFRRRAATCNRAIDVHMSGLRKKLGPRRDDGTRIRTVRGYGYIYTNTD